MALAQNYITVSRRPPDVEDYIDMMRRYRSWIIGPMFAGLVIATVIAFFWPDTYVSRATLRITPPSTTIVPSEFGSQMTQRLNDMENEILSRTTLEGIIRTPTLELYKREQSVKPMEDIVTEMRKDIDVRIIGSPMIGGDGRSMASAFQIQFKYPDRVKAQRVVSDLVSRFTESNQRVVRTQHLANASVIDDILKADKAKLDELDQKISQFNAENQGKLPEDFGSNQQMLSMLTLQATQESNQIQADREARLGLESQLKTYLAQQELMQSRIDEVVTVPGSRATDFSNAQLLQVVNELQKMDGQIAAMKNTLGENNPTMKEMRSQRNLTAAKKEELERDQEKAKAAAPAPSGPTTTHVTNPAVQAALVQIQGSIDQTRTALQSKELDITQLTAALADTRAKIGMYQSRIDAGPRSGQIYSGLMREHQMMQEQYDQDQKKKNMTEQAATVDDHKAGDNLDVLDPPSTPEQPVEPKRQLYAAVGTAIGLMVGIMLAGAKEVKNTSLKNLKDVRAYTNMPVLSSIPLLENALLVRRKRRLYWLAWSSSLIVGFIAMGASMYYYYSQTH